MGASTMIGTGLVWGRSGVCLSDFGGMDVVCVDRDPAKIDKPVNAGQVPTFGPGLAR